MRSQPIMNQMTSKPQVIGKHTLEPILKETEEWIQTIAFRKEEIHFLGDLLLNKIIRKGMRSEYGDMIIDLERLQDELFSSLEGDILAFKKEFSEMICSKERARVREYKRVHKRLADRMSVFTNDFRNYKKSIFGYVKEL